MLRIAIVDDEETVIDELKSIITSFFREQNIEISITDFTSGEEIVSYHQKYDLIFLDIQMQGIDGIQTAMEIRKADKNAVLFYVTSYGSEISRSFSVHPFAFIEKPVNEQLIRRNLQDYVEYAFKNKEEPKIQFQTINGTVMVSPDEILYFEYLGSRKIRFVTETSEYLIQEAITNIYPIVEQYGFLKPHQSFIVNPSKIKAVLDLDLIMLNDYKVPVAAKKKTIIRQQINDFLSSQFEED